MKEKVLIGQVAAPFLHVMTFNIRRRMPKALPPSADRWATRQPAVAELIRSERPTLLGVQEALPGQARFVAQTLGRGHRRIGHGRNADGQGEGTPLYFDTDRLRLLEWSQLALSDTPDKPGSRGWGNLTPRELVRAEFRDRATGIRFLAINTHFDNFSRRARVAAAAQVRQLVADSGLPAIVTGDLNTGDGTTALVELLRDGVLVDAWGAAEKRLTPEWGTFTNYRDPQLKRKRIDWIAVTPGVTVDRIGIDPRRPGGVWASDHLPVQAVVRLPEVGA
ncbi:endonuclease/exonuclease/phosphatase family protein [Herbiconiux solani]|uniref:endonuclease/exonuclease/phosphatase family protein n=1 Tax=Herbiconiux solani TaxID=661329 RepID=UPI000AC74855|nr:endonuclease/exonuclease/phosphatase family protein [Herbiconiux solani]